MQDYRKAVKASKARREEELGSEALKQSSRQAAHELQTKSVLRDKLNSTF